MTQNSGHNIGLPSPHVNMDIDEDGSNDTPTSDELLMYNGSSQQPSVSNSSHYHANQQWRDYYNQAVQSTSPPPAYHSENGTVSKGQVAPVHQYRSGSCGVESGSYREDPTIVLGDHDIDGVTATYQNWTKTPSDNGTATTSSTECTSTYEADLAEKNKSNSNNNNQYNLNGGIGVSQPQHHTPDAYSVHVPPTSLGMVNGRRYSEDLSSAISPMSYHHGSSYLPNGSGQFMDPASLSLSPSFCSNVKRKRNESLV